MSHQSELIGQDIFAYLKQHEQKDLLRFLTCGNVDDGKSTLIGRLLHDSKMIYEDQLEAVQRDSKKVGTQGDKVDLALLVDGLQAEREQGITIDVAYRYFSTEKRKFIIADTPGHEQYTRNMATGASTCDLAIILIDARYGVQTQTRRHSFIAALLGIRHIVVAINKMDLVDYSQQRFEQIQQDYHQFVRQLGDRTPSDIRFVPISALNGDNVVNVSEHTPWYGHETLMHILETVHIDRDTQKRDFRFPVQYVNRPHLDFRGFCGTIALGSVKVGDEVKVLPSGKTTSVKSIITYDGYLAQAEVGQAVTLTLEHEIDISRGDMLVHADGMPQVSSTVRATLVWMNEQALTVGKLYNTKVGVQNVPAKVVSIHYRVDVNTLAQIETDRLALNEIADVVLEFDRPIVFDRYQDSRLTGSFILIDRLSNATLGAGMIDAIATADSRMQAVSAEERAARLGQKPATISLEQVNHSEVHQLERLLLQKGIVAIFYPNLSSEQLKLLQVTGLVILTSQNQEADLNIDESSIDLIVERIATYVQL